MPGDLTIPPGAVGLVLFAHGSGSNRHSTRNQYVARLLNESSLATLLMDLLTNEEERRDLDEGAQIRFDIPLLAGRLAEAADWIAARPDLSKLPLGFFGASTGAAAALIAAAQRPRQIRCVVSRGGRPDLAHKWLRCVQAPVMFIVGSKDAQVLDLNHLAAMELPSGTERRLEVVDGATHLFEEPGALERVAALARNWFLHSLQPQQ